MKRLYNEHSAADANNPDVFVIEGVMEKAFDEVWAYVEKENICPRDAKNVCCDVLAVMFAEKILQRMQRAFKR